MALPAFGYTVAQMVTQQLPSGFVVSNDYITAREKWWQNILFTAANNTGATIADSDIYTEAAWPDRWNMLISFLVIYDVFQKALTGELLSLAGAGSEGVSGKGTVKTVKTGPTEVQYQDTFAAFTALMKIINTPQSPFFSVFTQACLLAHQLRVKIPFCPGNAQAFMFSKVNTNCKPCQQIVGPNGIFGPPSTGGVWNSGENYIP